MKKKILLLLRTLSFCSTVKMVHVKHQILSCIRCVCFSEPESSPWRHKEKVRPRLPGSEWHDVWPLSSWFRRRVSREQRHTGTKMTAFFLSVSQKQTRVSLPPSCNQSANIPLPQKRTHAVHHQTGAGYEWQDNNALHTQTLPQTNSFTPLVWCVDVQCFFRVCVCWGGACLWQHRIIDIYFFFLPFIAKPFLLD